MRRGLLVAATLGATLALAACSDGASGGSGTTTPVTPAASAIASPPVESPTSSPASGASSPGALATLPAEQCLTGRYALVRFVAVGDGSTYGTGQGGDVTIAFDGGRYTLAGGGKKPVVVTLAGQTGNLTVDGESSGAYSLDGARATFAPGSAQGGGTLDNGSGGDRAKLSMKQVDGVIGLAGSGGVECTDRVMTITLDAIRLELARA